MLNLTSHIAHPTSDAQDLLCASNFVFQSYSSSVSLTRFNLLRGCALSYSAMSLSTLR